MGEWFGEFFGALPDALEAFYQFGDPTNLGRGWLGFVIMLFWAGPLIGLPLLIAKRTYGDREWLSATMGVFAGTGVLFWVVGIIPHAWIQFSVSNRNLLAGSIIPETAGIELPSGYRIDIATDLYSVITESVVVLIHVVGTVAVLWGFARLQKRYPRTLVTGETKNSSGGYK